MENIQDFVLLFKIKEDIFIYREKKEIYTHERKIFSLFAREFVPTAATKWLTSLCGCAHRIILSGHVFQLPV